MPRTGRTRPHMAPKTQYADTDTDTADLVDAQSKLHVQSVCGTFLYYAISVDQTMLVTLNDIATEQAHSTTTTIGDIAWLLNYVETQPDATLQYHTSNMILHVSSDASYFCEECARSRSGDHFPLPIKSSKMATNRPPYPPTTAPSTPCAIS